MRRSLALVVLLAFLSGTVLAGCGGDDARPDRTIAFLRAVAAPGPLSSAFLAGLADAGWEPDDNLTIVGSEEAHPDVEDARAALHEWEKARLDLVVALSTTSAQTARDELPDTPVLFLVNDPTASGLVTNERKPEGKLTGVTFRVPAERTLEVATSLGDVRIVGVLWPEGDPAAEPVRDGLRRAAADLDVDLVDASFAGPGEIDGAVARLVDSGAQAIVLANAPSTVRAFDAIETAVAPAGVPIVANTACAFAVAVLAPDIDVVNAQLGRQAARLLRGSRVADVPVEDPGSFVLTLHRDVARRIQFDLSRGIVERADEVTG